MAPRSKSVYRCARRGCSKAAVGQFPAASLPPSLSGSGCSPGPPPRGREAAAAPPGVPGRAAEGARAAAACRWGSGSTNRLLLPKTASARRPPPLCLLPGKAARRGCGSRPRGPGSFTARALLRCSCSPRPGTRSCHPQDTRVVPPAAGRAGPTATRRGQPRCSWPSPPEQPPAALLWRRDPGNCLVFLPEACFEQGLTYSKRICFTFSEKYNFF